MAEFNSARRLSQCLGGEDRRSPPHHHVVSRDEARGLSYLTMISATPPAAAVAPYVSAGPVYFGEFKDRFLREGGDWKFLERRGSIQMKFFGIAAP